MTQKITHKVRDLREGETAEHLNGYVPNEILDSIVNAVLADFHTRYPDHDPVMVFGCIDPVMLAVKKSKMRTAKVSALSTGKSVSISHITRYPPIAPMENKRMIYDCQGNSLSTGDKVKLRDYRNTARNIQFIRDGLVHVMMQGRTIAVDPNACTLIE